MKTKKLQRDSVSLVFHEEVSTYSALYALAERVLMLGVTAIAGSVRVEPVPGEPQRRFTVDIEKEKDDRGE